MNQDEYLTLLSQSDLGEAWLHNLLISLENGECCSDSIQLVLDDAIAVLNSATTPTRPIDADDAFHAIESACQNTQVIGTNKRRKFASSNKPITHVTTMRSMIGYHFNVSKALAGTFYSHRATHHDDKIKILNAPEFQKASFAAKTPFAHLALSRLWVAHGDVVSRINDTRNSASKARDWRGLIQHSNADILVEYTLTLPKNAAFAKPTVVDGVGTRFKTAHSTSDWGCSVELEKLAKAEVDVSGANEGLYTPPSVNVVEKIRCLGIVGQGEPDGGVPLRGLTAADNDAAFNKFLQTTTGVTTKPALAYKILSLIKP